MRDTTFMVANWLMDVESPQQHPTQAALGGNVHDHGRTYQSRLHRYSSQGGGFLNCPLPYLWFLSVFCYAWICAPVCASFCLWSISFVGLLEPPQWPCFFVSLGLLPLPKVTALSYEAPLLTVVFMAMFINETMRVFASRPLHLD